MRNKDYLQYKKKLDSNLKISPENHVLFLREQIIQDIKQQNEQKIKNWIKALKMMIKDKIPAKPKFYALLLLKEMMETKDKTVVGYFATKIKQRLYLIAHHKSKSHLSLEERGKDCLKKYYSNKNEENEEYSIKFFLLLWECWREWDQMFSDKIKEIKNKGKILQKHYPKQTRFYNYFEEEYGLKKDQDKDQFQTIDHYSMIYDTKSNFNTNQSHQNKNGILFDSIFQKNLQDLHYEIQKLAHIFGNRLNAQRYNFQDFELIYENLKQSQVYFVNKQQDQIESLQEDVLQQIQKDFDYFEKTLLIFEKFKSQNIDENLFKQYMYQLYSEYHNNQNNNHKKNKFGSLLPIQEESKEFEQSNYNRDASFNTKRKSLYSIEQTKRDDIFSDFEKKTKDKQKLFEEYHKYDYSPQLTKSMKRQSNTPMKNNNFSQYSLKNDENFSQISKQFQDKTESQNELDFLKTNQSKFKKQNLNKNNIDDQINFDDFQDIQNSQNFNSQSLTKNKFFKKQNSESKNKKFKDKHQLQSFQQFDNNQKANTSIKNDFDDFQEFDDNQKYELNEKQKKSTEFDNQDINENEFDDFKDFNNDDQKDIAINQQNNKKDDNQNQDQQDEQNNNEDFQGINFDDFDEIQNNNQEEKNQIIEENIQNNKKSILTNKSRKSNKDQDEFFDDFDNLQFGNQNQKQDLEENFKSFKMESQNNLKDSLIETKPKNILLEKDNKRQSSSNQNSQNKESIKDMFDFDNFQIEQQKNQQQDNKILQNSQQINNEEDFNFQIDNSLENNKQKNELYLSKDLNTIRSSKNKSQQIYNKSLSNKQEDLIKTINKLNLVQSDDDFEDENNQSNIQKIKINRNKESIYQIQSNGLENLNSRNQTNNQSQDKEYLLLKKNYENLQKEYQKMLKNYATISQIDLSKFQFLLPKQKGLINQYFDQKIFQRKNEFLQNQNQILKQLNEELVDNSQNLQVKRISEAHVMKQLIQNYNDLVQNLKSEKQQLKQKAEQKDQENQELVCKFQKQSLYVNKIKNKHKEIQEEFYKLQYPLTKEEQQDKQIDDINFEESLLNQSLQRNSLQTNQTSKKQAKLKQKYKKNDVSMHFEKLSKGSIEPIKVQQSQSFQNNSMFQKMYKQLQVEKNQDNRISQKTLDLNQDNLKIEVHDISDNSLKDIIKDQASFLKQKKQEKLSNFTLQNYPVYLNEKNNILQLKASSLFENSLLFKNDFIQISCISQNYIHRSEKIVTLKLLYTPLQQNLKLSTRIESYENIQSIPKFIINQYFDDTIQQEFSFKVIGNFKNLTFQKLHIKLTFGQSFEQFNIPLPFTINKFLDFQQIDSNQLDKFLAQADYLKETQLKIDPDIIPSFENLLQIFPTIIALSETQLLLYIKFDYTKCMVLNICQENENQIKLDILGKKMYQEFEWFYEWFTWIFTN